MSENQANKALSETNAQEETNESSPLPQHPNQETHKPSKKRTFDTFYLFCVVLLALAIGVQLVAIIAYR